MCVHPLKGFKVGKTLNGKNALKITGYDIKFLYAPPGSDDYEPFSYQLPWMIGNNYIYDFIEIPCGQCVECRLKRSRQWADRCMLESLYHDKNYFITLTYDNDNVHFGPPVSHIDSDTGELTMRQYMTLDKRDLTLFIKQLRYYTPFRYFACGEYGDETARPHFHLCAFGLDIADKLEPYKKNDLGHQLYKCSWLDEIWGHGFVTVADLSWETCAYTARYVMKKQTGFESHIYEDKGIVPEYVVMSRRPGIAYQYFEDHGDTIYETDELFIKTLKGGKRGLPPRYFDKLYEIEDPEHMESVRNLRQLKGELAHINLGMSNSEYIAHCERKGNAKERSIKKLVRKDI